MLSINRLSTVRSLTSEMSALTFLHFTRGSPKLQRASSIFAQRMHAAFLVTSADEPIGSGAGAVDVPVASTTYRPPLGSSLQRYGRDLTADAARGLLDPLLGRASVVERALRILMRRTKNNPILLGDPGVGKTAIVEGIAQVAVSQWAPPMLRGTSIVSLDLGALVAGTQWRGAFEDRLQGILSDVRAASGRVILFIDEMHMIMDAGRVEGGMNAANLLKPALARGELRCIGATTIEEYRKHIEVDAAFARRLQPVIVEEPEPEEAIRWLKGLAHRYERHHSIRFADDAIPAAVAAAQRFVPDRRLPDSALDLLDEAAARAQLQGDRVAAALLGEGVLTAAEDDSLVQEMSPPPPYLSTSGKQRTPEEVRDLLEWFGAAPSHPLPGFDGHRQTAEARRMRFLEQMRLQEGGPPVPKALGVIVSASSLACPHCGTPTAREVGVGTVTCPNCRFRFLNLPTDKLMLGASLFIEAQREECNTASEKNNEEQAGLGEQSSSSSLIMPDETPLVTAVDVLEVVACAAGVPLSQILSLQSTWDTLQRVESSLLENVIGQNEAARAVIAAVRLGLALGSQSQRRRPLAVIALVGSTGTGKRTLSRALAQALYASDRALVQFDLAQATDKTAVSRLVGAPPGFVGYGEGGALTEAIRRRPHSVVILENAHKAHPDVLALVRQIVEEGRLDDSMGRRADFRNTVILMALPPALLPFLSSTNEAQGTAKGRLQRSTSVQTPPEMIDRLHATNASQSQNEASQHSAAALPLEGDATGGRGLPHTRNLPLEFVSYLDAIAIFHPLTESSLQSIARKVVEEAVHTLKEQGIDLTVTERALAFMGHHAFATGMNGTGISALVRSSILEPALDALLNSLAHQGGDAAPGGEALRCLVDVGEGQAGRQSINVTVQR